MIVRDYEPSDLKALTQIHNNMGFDSKLQDLEAPLILTKKVVTDANGTVIGACYTKLQAETYLLLDPALSPADKVDVIHRVDDEVANESYGKGLDQLVAYLPPGIETKFHKRLRQLGWSPARDDWKPWSKELTN